MKMKMKMEMKMKMKMKIKMMTMKKFGDDDGHPVMKVTKVERSDDLRRFACGDVWCSFGPKMQNKPQNQFAAPAERVPEHNICGGIVEFNIFYHNIFNSFSPNIFNIFPPIFSIFSHNRQKCWESFTLQYLKISLHPKSADIHLSPQRYIF